MWLPILIVCMAIAMILGPIMLMQPTQQQRRSAARRQHALSLGLRVHLQPPPVKCGLGPEVKQVAMYCLPWKDSRMGRSQWVLVRTRFSHDLHFCGAWDWEVKADEKWQLSGLNADHLALLGDDILAVAAGPQGLCCYWRESGDLDRVDSVAVWLKDTADQLSEVKSG